jgi:tetratricopeptide (TPR) repeat protein
LQRAAVCWERHGDLRSAAIILRGLGWYAESARLWLRHGNYENAAADFRQAGQPESQAECLQFAGRWAEAAAIWLDLHHSDQRFGRQAAQCSEMLGQWSSAARLWEEIGDHSNAARCREAAGDWVQAARHHLDLYSFSRAAAFYERAQQWQDAAECWSRAFRWTQAARAWARAGDLQQASACYDRAGLSEEVRLTLEKYAARNPTPSLEPPNQPGETTLSAESESQAPARNDSVSLPTGAAWDGSISISARKDDKAAVYFDLVLWDFDRGNYLQCARLLRLAGQPELAARCSTLRLVRATPDEAARLQSEIRAAICAAFYSHGRLPQPGHTPPSPVSETSWRPLWPGSEKEQLLQLTAWLRMLMRL